MPVLTLEPPVAWAEGHHRGVTVFSVADVRWLRTSRRLCVVQPLYHACGPRFSLQGVSVRDAAGGSSWSALDVGERHEGSTKDGSIVTTFHVPRALEGCRALEVRPTIDGADRPSRRVSPLPEPAGDRALLGSTTLFLHDHALLARHVDYYHRAHGVDVFLLFYNGLLRDAPQVGRLLEEYTSTRASTRLTVLLASWPFPYWQTFCPCAPSEGIWHGAQGTQIALASIVASRWCRWLLHADLDEYVAYGDGSSVADELRDGADAVDRSPVYRNTFVPCGGYFCGHRDFLRTAGAAWKETTRWWIRLPPTLRDLVWRLPAGPLDDRSKYVQRTSQGLQPRGIHMPSSGASEVPPDHARLIQMSCWSGARLCRPDARLATIMQGVFAPEG